jgi:hypothetical protein
VLVLAVAKLSGSALENWPANDSEERAHFMLACCTWHRDWMEFKIALSGEAFNLSSSNVRINGVKHANTNLFVVEVAIARRRSNFDDFCSGVSEIFAATEAARAACRAVISGASFAQRIAQ